MDYNDNKMEMVLVAKECFMLKLSLEDIVELDISIGEKLVKRHDLLALVALEEGNFGHGDLVWAKVKGYLMWSAVEMNEDHAIDCRMKPSKQGIFLL